MFVSSVKSFDREAATASYGHVEAAQAAFTRSNAAVCRGLAWPVRAMPAESAQSAYHLGFRPVGWDPFRVTRPPQLPRAILPIATPDDSHRWGSPRRLASFMIAAGGDAKALSAVMGHASIEITLNRYGHLMPVSEDRVGELLGAYLGA